MIFKNWKKVAMVILIIACVFNIMNKLINKFSLNEEMIYSATYMLNQDENVENISNN